MQERRNSTDLPCTNPSILLYVIFNNVYLPNTGVRWRKCNKYPNTSTSLMSHRIANQRRRVWITVRAIMYQWSVAVAGGGGGAFRNSGPLSTIPWVIDVVYEKFQQLVLRWRLFSTPDTHILFIYVKSIIEQNVSISINTYQSWSVLQCIRHTVHELPCFVVEMKRSMFTIPDFTNMD